MANNNLEKYRGLSPDQILKMWQDLPLAEHRQRMSDAWQVVVAPLGMKAGNETITLQTLENSKDYSPLIQALRRDHLFRSFLQQASARDINGQDRAADPDLVAAFLFSGKEEGYIRMRARLLRTARLVTKVTGKPLLRGFTKYYVKDWLNSLSQDQMKAVRNAETQLPETPEGDIFSLLLAELNQAQTYGLDELIAWANRPSKPREAGKPTEEEEEEEEDLADNLPPAAKPEAAKPAPAPEGKKVAPAPPAPTAPPPAEEAKPAVSAVDEENRKLMLAAIKKAAESHLDSKIRVTAKAFLYLREKEATADELMDFVISKGLL
jgi:hypothetical protein